MTKDQLRKFREELKNRLQGTLNPTRITNLTENGCIIEGGKLPARYDRKTESLIVWNRGTRYSSTEISVAKLFLAERILENFFDEFFGLFKCEEKENAE